MASNSIENIGTDAILMTTTGTGIYGHIVITGLQCSLYSNNSGRVVKISAATNGVWATNGSIAGVVIDGLVCVTDGTARAAIELVNTDRVTLGNIQLVQNFTSRYTSSGDTNTTDTSSASIDYAEAGDLAPVGETADAGVSTEIPRADHVHTIDPDAVQNAGRWEHAVIAGSPPDDLYADGDWLYIWVP
jgi:hypothetical protein